MLRTGITKKEFRETLCCPSCTGPLTWDAGGAACSRCQRVFAMVNDCPNFLPPPLDALVAQDPFGVTDRWNRSRCTWYGAASNADEGMLPDGHRFIEGCQGTILDIGCGRNPASDCAVDVFMPRTRPEHFALAQAEQLPFKPKSFDVVHAAFVIEHTLRPTDFILALCRIARSRVIFTTDNGEWLGIFAFRLLNRGFLFHDEHMHLWTVPYIANLCRRLELKTQVTLLNNSKTWFTRWFAALGRVPRLKFWFRNTIRVEIDLA